MIGNKGWGSKLEVSTDNATWTKVAQLRSFKFDGQELEIIDASDMGSVFKKKLPGQIDAGTFSYDGVLNPNDAGYGALKTYQESKTYGYFKLTLPVQAGGTAATVTFRGYIKTHQILDVDVKKLFAFAGKIEIDGQVTVTTGTAWPTR